MTSAIDTHGSQQGEHDSHLAHHFDTPKQQFDSGKLGIWIFLVTEVLFFSGLFCAYAIYRSLHPELFKWGHQFLSVELGGLNTCVLLFSSLTIAWAVRCAQLNQKRGLIACLVLTLICAFGFLGIKYVEYSHKLHEGLSPGRYYSYVEHEGAAAASSEKAATEGHGTAAAPQAHAKYPTPENPALFFSIYYCMTGLHGIHVIAGIIVIFWMLLRAMKGEFSSAFFGPIDYVALYWHLVDIVWIFLFPLLYLIH